MVPLISAGFSINPFPQQVSRDIKRTLLVTLLHGLQGSSLFGLCPIPCFTSLDLSLVSEMINFVFLKHLFGCRVKEKFEERTEQSQVTFACYSFASSAFVLMFSDLQRPVGWERLSRYAEIQSIYCCTRKCKFGDQENISTKCMQLKTIHFSLLQVILKGNLYGNFSKN